MPQYILPIDSVETAREFNELDSFTQGYIAALFWTEEERLAEEGCENAGPGDMLPDFLKKCVADCARFQTENADDLEAATERGRDAECCGHDFWLTRNGHGVGFWDRPELEAGDLGESLSEAARRFGTVDVGTDGNGKVCA